MINIKKMKTLILVILAFILIGCSNNPINPVETDSNDSVYASVTIMQDYGYCDSNGCYGESVIIYNRTINDFVTINELFNTEGYLRIIGGIKYSCNGFTLVYETNHDCTLEIIGTNESICFNGSGQVKIILNYNTNYNILWGIQ